MTFHSHELGIFLKPIVFLVYLSEFYTHLNAITVEKFSLNIVFKLYTPIHIPFYGSEIIHLNDF